jgi:iron(III) transport system ATP-binding protein
LIAEFLGQAIVLPARLAAGWAQCDLGRIAVDARHGHGDAQIMLRPEQISLEQVTADQAAAQADGVLGEVTEVDFGGSVCTVAVRLLNGTSLSHGATDGASLLFQKPSSGLLPIGAVVRIRVAGAAHVFDRPVETVA